MNFRSVRPYTRSLTLAAFFMAMVAPAQSELIPLGSVWRYQDNGTDPDGVDPEGTWATSGFDDSGWAAGGAELGYGDLDEVTVLSFGGDAANKYVTTYFRHSFEVIDPSIYSTLNLEVRRDDGVVVYLNGNEIFRDNLPTGPITDATFATVAISGADESALLSTSIAPSGLVVGTNVVAVEIHQANLTSTDISFDLRFAEPPPASLSRGPYLQRASASQVTVRWRTTVPTDSVVNYGTDPANLTLSASAPTDTTEHELTIAGLTADTRYYYSVGSSETTFASGADYYMHTHPVSGVAAPTHIWVLGDSGTANADAAAVRDSFLTYNGNDPHSDLLLMLGDNAYSIGTDAQYQAAVFDMYPTVLRNTVLWSCLGNHDGASADSVNQTGPYYDLHTFPTSGESGGLASGTEAYYSFDYANIHFVCLDSYETDRSPGGTMAIWLGNDLAATSQEWIIAFWHHPPYTKGSHNSDTEIELIEMRTNFLPILESYGVDLVLGGHSHSYERSKLIDGHYGTSGTLVGNMILDGGDGHDSGDGAYRKSSFTANTGAVYVVAGSSGKISSAPLNHPVMITNLVELGSMVLDVNDKQLDALFLNSNGVVRDRFTIIHTEPSTEPPVAPSSLAASVLGPEEIALSWTDNSDDEQSFTLQRSVDSTNWTTIASLPADSDFHSDGGLTADTEYLYRVFATNSVGDSAFSNLALATTESLPPFLDTLIASEIAGFGTLDGDFTRTYADDDSVQALTEVESGGKPSKRHSRLRHTWEMTLPPGLSSVLFVNAYASVSSDGDDFDFEYSTDAGETWNYAFTVSANDSANTESSLLAGASGNSLVIRVSDTDQGQGNRALDTLYVDSLFVRTETVAGDPPEAPSTLTAVADSSDRIDLTWVDHSLDELGFELERLAPSDPDWVILANLAADSTGFSDLSVAPSTSYSYRIRSYNASGSSLHSNVASATTLAPDPSAIVLSTVGRKVRGVIHADLTWTGITTSNVEIYRNGALSATVPNTGSYSDNTGVKGGGSFAYQVCEEGNPAKCSNVSSVTF